MSAGAVFLDRDGTIIDDPPPGYIAQPERVRLLPGALAGLAQLARWGWPLVIVSNQSGIARGFFAQAAFHNTMDRLQELVTPSGVRFLAAYFCPHHPDLTGPCECRKPGSRLYQRAARDFFIDLAASWYLGNRWSDIEPALTLGGHGVLVTADTGSDDANRARQQGFTIAKDLAAAAHLVGPPLPQPPR